MEFEARKLLMERLDQNLLDHARELCAGDGPGSWMFTACKDWRRSTVI